MKYVPFTPEQKQRARQTDIADLLRRQGEAVKKSGTEFVWLDGSQKVTVRGHLWFNQYERVGGDAIDFVRRYYNKTYPEAVKFLLNEYSGAPTISPPVVKETKPFQLPKRNDNMRRVFAYLINSRGIDRDVIYSFVHKKMIYESAKYHNIVFVGYDNEGRACHAHMRGTATNNSYKSNVSGSLPEYSFHWNGTSNNLYLFESPIDMLSFITLNKGDWQKHSYASACGVSEYVLWQMLKNNENINTVYLCFDNDEAGQKANKRIAEKLKTKEINHEILVPTRKDWNEDVLFINDMEVKECQTLQL